MLTLTETTDAIEVSTLAAHATNALQCKATWRDITDTPTFAYGRSLINTTGVTPLDLVTGPAASTQRAIDSITVENNDTVNHFVKVAYDANGTEYPLYRAALGPSETLHYGHRFGWRITTPQVVAKTVVIGVPLIPVGIVGTDWTTLVLADDVPSNSSQFANKLRALTELAVPVKAAQRYVIQWRIFYNSAATTTGSRWNMFPPPHATDGFFVRAVYPSGSGAIIIERMLHPDEPSVTGATSAAVGNTARIDCLILPTNSGVIFPTFASEISDSAITVKKGSFVEYLAV